MIVRSIPVRVAVRLQVIVCSVPVRVAVRL